jgi:uncharacterized protein
MDDSFLASLRCPIDPDRQSGLTRDRDQLVCSQCAVRFPIKNGIPVLIADEADLPPSCPNRSQLPCQPRR